MKNLILFFAEHALDGCFSDEVVAHINAGLTELRKGTPILDKGAIE